MQDSGPRSGSRAAGLVKSGGQVLCVIRFLSLGLVISTGRLITATVFVEHIHFIMRRWLLKSKLLM